MEAECCQSLIRKWRNGACISRGGQQVSTKHLLDGVGAGNDVVKIQSYVAFLWTSKLASLLLFEYVMSGCANSKMPLLLGLLNSVVEPTTTGCTTTHGVSSCVSSAGRVFRRSNADMPARSAVPTTIVQGLRCLAHFRVPKCEVKIAREFLHIGLLQLVAACCSLHLRRCEQLMSS